MKKNLFLYAATALMFGIMNQSLAAAPPVPTSADNLLKQYKQQQQQSVQKQSQQPTAQPPQKPAQTQKPQQQPTQTQSQTKPASGPLSIDKLEAKLEQAVGYIKSGNNQKAEQILEPLVIWLTDSTEYHILLLNTLKDIPDAQYQTEIERAFAVKSALLRDKSLFYYGIALMGNQKNEEAARNFILVVQSQPKSKLGFDAYTRLQMLGFTQKVQFNHLEDVEK